MIDLLHNRLVSFLAPVLAWLLGGILLLAIIAGYAHADTGAATTPELGLETRIAAWAVAVYAVARTVLELLKVIAPRTRTTADDEVRDALARILADARPPAEPPRLPPNSMSGTLGVLVIGLGLALQPGCAATEKYTDTAGHALYVCGKQDLTAIAATAAGLGARAALDSLAYTYYNTCTA